MKASDFAERCGEILEGVVFPCENAGRNAGVELAALLAEAGLPLEPEGEERHEKRTPGDDAPSA
jgi:hypothetical protein